MRGQRYHGDRRQCGLFLDGADFGGGDIAVHHRHFAVHQHQVEGAACGAVGRHRFFTIAADHRADAQGAEDRLDHVAVDVVVLGNQYVQVIKAAMFAHPDATGRGALQLAVEQGGQSGGGHRLGQREEFRFAAIQRHQHAYALAPAIERGTLLGTELVQHRRIDKDVPVALRHGEM